MLPTVPERRYGVSCALGRRTPVDEETVREIEDGRGHTRLVAGAAQGAELGVELTGQA